MTLITSQPEHVCPFCDHVVCTCEADEAAYQAGVARKEQERQASYDAYVARYEALTPDEKAAFDDARYEESCRNEDPYFDCEPGYGQALRLEHERQKSENEQFNEQYEHAIKTSPYSNYREDGPEEPIHRGRRSRRK